MMYYAAFKDPKKQVLDEVHAFADRRERLRWINRQDEARALESDDFVVVRARRDRRVHYHEYSPALAS